MSKSVFSNTSRKMKNKPNTSSVVQKPYLRTIYNESNTEEYSDIENHFKVENLFNPFISQEAVSKIAFIKVS